MKIRYGFKLETYIYTFRNYFPNKCQTGAELAKLLEDAQRNGKMPTVPYGTQSVSVSDIAFKNNELIMLFQLYDPLIPDPDYINTNNGTIRTALRRKDEEPARSAHFVMDVSPQHDLKRSYPSGLENVEYLSRSLISRYLNDVLEQLTSTQGHLEKLP